MSSGDDDSKDQQTCQTSTWLHFSLQTGGPIPTIHMTGDTENGRHCTLGNAVQQGGIHENESVRRVRAGVDADRGTAAAQPVPLD